MERGNERQSESKREEKEWSSVYPFTSCLTVKAFQMIRTKRGEERKDRQGMDEPAHFIHPLFSPALQSNWNRAKTTKGKLKPSDAAESRQRHPQANEGAGKQPKATKGIQKLANIGENAAFRSNRE